MVVRHAKAPIAQYRQLNPQAALAPKIPMSERHIVWLHSFLHRAFLSVPQLLPPVSQ
jgi:hypothetical protein